MILGSCLVLIDEDGRGWVAEIIVSFAIRGSFPSIESGSLLIVSSCLLF